MKEKDNDDEKLKEIPQITSPNSFLYEKTFLIPHY